VETYHPYRRLSDHLTLVADAVLLSVFAGAALIVAKQLARIPAAWIDSMYAFLATMAIASLIGGTAAWWFHRRTAGVRGWRLLATGLAAAIAVVLILQVVVTRMAISSPDTAPWFFAGAQVLGLMVMLPPLVAGAAEVFVRKRRHFDAVAVARLIAFAALVGFVAFWFLPGAWSDSATAYLDATLGLATIAGGLGAGLADVLLLASDRRASRPGSTSETPTDAA
jgi:hypothetical protein